MALYRCTNCGRDFENDRPACAQCDIDPAKDPRLGRFIIRLEIVHFDPPTRFPGMGQGHAACNPLLKVGKQIAHATGDPSCVNCTRCRETEAWKTANAGPQRELVADQDFKVEVKDTPAGVVVEKVA
jgi:hypothetical protein